MQRVSHTSNRGGDIGSYGLFDEHDAEGGAVA